MSYSVSLLQPCISFHTDSICLAVHEIHHLYFIFIILYNSVMCNTCKIVLVASKQKIFAKLNETVTYCAKKLTCIHNTKIKRQTIVTSVNILTDSIT